ncbi:MAG: VOC family protein, partial [Proteobacteria bacterium]|nr:VOC family protein [Pseudomonadota bacterium]
AAQFYEKVFDLERVGRDDLSIGSAVYLTDGEVNLALLNITSDKVAGDMANHVGAHHFGFQVDDLEATQKRIEEAGGTFFFDFGGSKESANFEKKFKDAEGVDFDISLKGWIGTAGN